MEQKGNGFRFAPHVHDKANIAKCLTTKAGSRMDDNYIIDVESKNDKFEFSSKNDELKAIRLFGLFDKENSKHQAGSVWDKEGLAPTLDTMQGGYRQPLTLLDNKIRKLTPNECWKLMDFDKDAFNKVKGYISDSQLYKIAGNSICVSCLEYIFKEIKTIYKECD